MKKQKGLLVSYCLIYQKWRNSKWFMKSVTVFIIPTMTQRCARSICQKNSNDSPHSPLRRSTHAPRNQKESRLLSFIKNDRSVFLFSTPANDQTKAFLFVLQRGMLHFPMKGKKSSLFSSIDVRLIGE
ncbi:hypothetical protein QWV57_07580 [Geobacillus zalihae]|uniref:hypothetical protein n=1 Tax=Geobacillus TaxID=129337 RepID=UPI0002AF44D4|nr:MULTISPECIES: hypothetical protein [Geobacillus]AGE22074.1 hypothetical protein GHH_c15430 [Geobacillus sp. GHH01]WKA48793.1 hypothetical protein QWV57_07580 [Geobacillus zalihae]